ncbi:hypothetical protein I7I48_09642 [Histoplasma ohiense]|nr:hypothetical protein I7I48_09642 [Histoplasma ohiense (nom. inval.)]
MTLVLHVIARRGSRLPPRLLGCQSLGGNFQIVQFLQVDIWFPARHTGGVREQLPDFDVLFPIRGKLGPVGGYFFKKVELAAVNKHQGRKVRDGLRCRPDSCDGVAGPGRCASGVAIASPYIYDVAPVDVDCDGCTQLFACVYEFLQQILDGREGCVVITLDCASHCFS